MYKLYTRLPVCVIIALERVQLFQFSLFCIKIELCVSVIKHVRIKSSHLKVAAAGSRKE